MLKFIGSTCFILKNLFTLTLTLLIYLSYSGERWQYAAVPVEWSASGNDYTAMGVVGYVMSGGTVYDHRSSPMGDIASYNEWDSLDPSFGHSDNNNQYHYHAVSIVTFIPKE